MSPPHAAPEDALLRRVWRALHGIALGRLDGERQAGQAIGDQVDPQDLQRQERQGHAQEGGQEHDPDLAGVGGHGIADKLADIVIDAAPFFHRGDDGGIVIVQEHHVRGLFGNIGASNAHGNADIGALESRSVIDAVAGHGDDVALLLQSLDDLELMLRRDACIDRQVFDDCLQLSDGHFCQFNAGEHLVVYRQCPILWRCAGRSEGGRR